MEATAGATSPQHSLWCWLEQPAVLLAVAAKFAVALAHKQKSVLINVNFCADMPRVSQTTYQGEEACSRVGAGYEVWLGFWPGTICRGFGHAEQTGRQADSWALLMIMFALVEAVCAVRTPEGMPKAVDRPPLSGINTHTACHPSWFKVWVCTAFVMGCARPCCLVWSACVQTVGRPRSGDCLVMLSTRQGFVTYCGYCCCNLCAVLSSGMGCCARFGLGSAKVTHP